MGHGKVVERLPMPSCYLLYTPSKLFHLKTTLPARLLKMAVKDVSPPNLASMRVDGDPEGRSHIGAALALFVIGTVIHNPEELDLNSSFS